MQRPSLVIWGWSMLLCGGSSQANTVAMWWRWCRGLFARCCGGNGLSRLVRHGLPGDSGSSGRCCGGNSLSRLVLVYHRPALVCIDNSDVSAALTRQWFSLCCSFRRCCEENGSSGWLRSGCFLGDAGATSLADLFVRPLMLRWRLAWVTSQGHCGGNVHYRVVHPVAAAKTAACLNDTPKEKVHVALWRHCLLLGCASGRSCGDSGPSR